MKRMLRRLPALERQRGQVMVIFALMLPVFIGMLGLGIDAAHMFQSRRSIQSAADLAALAGASQLPADPNAARAVALDIAAQNGYTEGVTVNVPFNGDPKKIEVRITDEVGTYFMPALGLPTVNITARTVAQHEVTGDGAILAKKDYHCWDGTITWTGRNIKINGSVHSNGGMTLRGNGNSVTGDLTYKVGLPQYPLDGRTSCADRVTDTDPTLNPQPAPWRDWPFLYTTADFPCTFTIPSHGDITRDGDWWVGGRMNHSRTLKPGVICYNSTSNWLRLEADNISGTVTFRAPLIRISGTNINLKPYKNDVLIFSNSTEFPCIDLRPNGGTWEGIIYNYSGNPTATVQGGQTVITGANGFKHLGSVIGWAVTLAGNNWSLAGNDAPVYEPMRIVE